MDDAPEVVKPRGRLTRRPWIITLGLILGALIGTAAGEGIHVLRGGHADWAVVLGVVLGAAIVGVPLSLWIRWADRPTTP
jgi:hypothetical protein